MKTVAILPAGDRFEDFHDKVGVTLEDFRSQLTGGWLFNYVESLLTVGVDSVLVFSSARVDHPTRFRHEPTGCQVSVLPAPRIHRLVRAARWRWSVQSGALRSLEAYVATPPRLLAKELRLRRCDAILCQEYESPRFDLCVNLGRLLGIPVFGTYQGAVSGYSSLERPLRRRAIRRCAGLLVGASRERARLRLDYGLAEAKVIPLPNPVDVKAMRPVDKASARRALGVSLQARVVVWHGRVQLQRKGLDLLLEAWRRVLARRPDRDLLLLLVGSGTDDARLRTLVHQMPPGSVLWVDEYLRNRDRIRELLSAADIAVLASRHEGFPVAVVEAMASGLAVVAADVDGVREAVGDDGSSGVVVPVGDVDRLAEALLTAVDDPEGTAAQGRAGRARAECLFSLGSVGRRLGSVISR